MRATWARYGRAATKKSSTSATDVSAYSWLNTQAPKRVHGPLNGLRVAIKDNIACDQAPTSSSSRILEDFYPPYTATCVSSLIKAGAHVVGQNKMDEFGMGSSTSHLPPDYSPVYNPSGPAGNTEKRSPGGSSGGSAAAVADGSCDVALGTDTGGSVRLPAAYCGVAGLKPSYGLISRHGVIAYADSLDCVGVLGKSVHDVRHVFETISHPDSRDMTCVSVEDREKASTALEEATARFPSFPDSPLNGLRIGLPRQSLLPKPHVQVQTSLLRHLRGLGATLYSVDLPSMKMALPAYYVLASAEASSNLGRYGGAWFGWDGGDSHLQDETGEERRRTIRSSGFGLEVKKRLIAGTWALSADEFDNTYLKALKLRHLLRRDFDRSFRIPQPLNPDPSSNEDGVDVLLHPTAIRTAPKIGESASGKDEYLQDLLTVPASLAGLPAMSVPAGSGEDGWPVGISVVGQWGMEEIVFWVGKAIEEWSRSHQ